MKENEIIVKESFFNKLIPILFLFAFILVLIIKSDNFFLDKKRLSQNGMVTFVFGFLIVFFLISVLKIFDNKPILKINEEGFCHRNTFFPFFSLKFWEWNEIDFVELNTVSYSKHKKGKGLIVYKKNGIKRKIIYLENLNYPEDNIITMFKNHSKFLDYYNRTEIKNNCR
ncbi:hypothetical protein NHF50_15180 [Flavobacterium sp. NRK F10]|uniref:hypothetical protein n=1 Tax=Flavobacterium sp. NRK F10 TaxID=2954931 RepID=UPI0020911D0B|nr:hypothetical protein [Flavobacterium sp. NRK F10]MCO6176391.1 hypothetical protein [Flavobacterium sp. NRK F10]